MKIFVVHPNGTVEGKLVPSHVMTRHWRRWGWSDHSFSLLSSGLAIIAHSVFLEAKRQAVRNPYLPAVCRKTIASAPRSAYVAQKPSAMPPALPLKAKAVTYRTSSR